jgi:gliding motility-associated-like protein
LLKAKPLLKRDFYIIAFGLLHFICLRSAGQMTMADHVCAGQTKHYYVNPGQVTGSTYTWWIDGNVVQGFNASEFIHTWNSSDTYMLEVQELSAEGCPGQKLSGFVLVNPQPEIQVGVSDTLICDGESFTISVQNPADIIWGKWIYDLIVEPEAGVSGNTLNGTYTSPSDLNETLFYNGRAIRKVVYRFIPRIVDDVGVQACSGNEVKITVWVYPGFRCKEAFLEVPNAFSPNGDGINDVWNITGKDFYPDIEVTIYNRWGQAVWKSGRGYPVPWDGRSRGKALPMDSYHYFIELQGRSKTLMGTVTVVR